MTVEYENAKIGVGDNPYGSNNVVIGPSCLEQEYLPNNCVIIGSGLTADHDCQVKVGNSVVEISRTMTPEEFESVKQVIDWAFGKSQYHFAYDKLNQRIDYLEGLLKDNGVSYNG